MGTIVSPLLLGNAVLGNVDGEAEEGTELEGRLLVGLQVGVRVGFRVGKEVGAVGLFDGGFVGIILFIAPTRVGLYVGSRVVGTCVGAKVHPN